jgi:hypothetical protein
MSAHLSFDLDLGTGSLLAATSADVIVRGRRYTGEDRDEGSECTIAIGRKIYLKAIVECLDQKASYYKNWKEFCGLPRIISEKFRAEGTAQLRSKTSDEMCTVVHYRALSVFVELEHG